MSLARDTAIVLESHDDRISKAEEVLGDHETRLERVGYFLAALDRKEAAILAEVDRFRNVVQSQFRELREELRVGKNGH